MNTSLRPYMLEAGQGLANSSADVKASGDSTGGNFTLIESRTTGGAALHVHHRDDEYFYVIKGTITVNCGDEHYEAGAGAFVFLPRGIPHEWDVLGEEATLLMMTVPAGLDKFLAEYHSASSAEERNQIASQYGIEFL